MYVAAQTTSQGCSIPFTLSFLTHVLFGGTPLFKKTNRGCDLLVSQKSRLVLQTCIITTTTYTWHPNDCCSNWKRYCFGMLLEASTTKTEDKYICVYTIHIYTYIFIYVFVYDIMLIYTMFPLLPTRKHPL